MGIAVIDPCEDPALWLGGTPLVVPGREEGSAIRVEGVCQRKLFVQTPVSNNSGLRVTVALAIRLRSVYNNGWSSDRALLYLAPSSGALSYQPYLIRNPDGSLRTKINNIAVETPPTDPGLLPLDIWTHIEWCVTPRTNDDGIVQLYVNGVLVQDELLDFFTSAEPVAQVATGTVTSGLLTDPYYWAEFDDIIVGVDVPVLGNSKVYVLRPTGSAVNEWAGSDGNSVDNHLLVDDGDKDSADYVSSQAGDGETDLYTTTLPIPASSTIHAVQEVVGGGTDAAGTSNLNAVVKSAGSESVKQLAPAAETRTWMYGDLLETDPATGLPWTGTAVQNIQFGVRS